MYRDPLRRIRYSRDIKRCLGIICLLSVGITASIFSSRAVAQESSPSNGQSPSGASRNHAEPPYRLLPPLYISKDQIRPSDIGGLATVAGRPVVHGWVIAETTDLDKPYRQLVFTDSSGRYIFRNLLPATYSLSVSGYDLGESPRVKAKRGQTVELRASAVPRPDAGEWDAKWAALIASPIEIITLQRDELPNAAFVKTPADGRYVFSWLPAPSSPDEPIASKFSMSRSIKFIDSVNLAWIRKEGCVTCHTTYQYLVGRPLLGDGDTKEAIEVRKSVERQIVNSYGGSLFNTIPLALNDAAAGNGLSPIVRSALDNLMSKQGAEGGWHGAMTFTPPFEDGDYYPNVMAAVAIGNAPDHYASTEKGGAALAKLVHYLKRAPAQNLHSRALLLWASMSTPALMDEAGKTATVNDLLSKQRADGGWSLTSLGNWSRHDGTRDDPTSSPSDGYGTGLVTYVLLKAGVPAQTPALLRAVEWLKTHQRVSGRWFTPSLNYDDGVNIMTNSGTIYAMMALRASGVGGGDGNDSTR